ncbi:choice-of-anchor M domain-containing protein [Corynebacterium gottingense]|uniref:choice-of-anchor M domain-containing protein n=1 Tax=Corynebacterium gottingense TaxID=2041036 RepID=UPI0038CFB3F4
MKLQLAALTLAAATSLAPVAGAQGMDNDPALQQTVRSDEAIAPAGEQAVISAGHVDLGATFDGDELTFLARDDSQDPPVWRRLDDVVFQVSDDAKQTLPDTGAFDFTGAGAGDDVWVIPQTEVQGVPWLGWNTQSPSLLERSSNGVSLEFGGHEGDGDFSLFLQPGGFHEPQLLWSSREDGTQPMWVEPNTHTHANWVFTQPGVQLVGVRAVVKDNEGNTHTDEEVVRIAVGSVTDPAEAQAAEFSGPWRGAENGDENEATDGATDAAAGSSAGSNAGLLVALGIGVLVVALVALLVVRSRKGRA